MAQGYEIRVRGAGAADVSSAGAVEVLKERIARVLCPVEDHNGPCEVPWGFTLADDSDDLLLGIYSSAEKATEVFARVKAVADGRPVELTEGEPDRFEDLATQYRIEHERQLPATQARHWFALTPRPRRSPPGTDAGWGGSPRRNRTRSSPNRRLLLAGGRGPVLTRPRKP